MDKVKRDWGWMKAQAPELSAVIADLRREFGLDWVNACWHSAIVKGEGGWFFAKTGPIAVGTSWPDMFDDLLRYEERGEGQSAGLPLVCMRKPGGERTAWGSWVYVVRGWQHGA